MPKTSTPADSSSNQPGAVAVKHVSHAEEPLSSINLLRAGVPVQEVVWFRRLKPDRKMAALSTWRGSLLLERVRSFVAANDGSASHALAA